MQTHDIISIHLDDGIRTALVLAVGPKFTRMIWIQDSTPGIKIHKVLNSEIRARVIDYPLSRCRRTFLKAGRRLGISKSARRALQARSVSH